MNALAEYIMRGRMQAASIAILGYVIPMLTPVTVALVTLRRGANEGTLMLLISLIPAIAAIVLSGSSSVVLWLTFFSLLVVLMPSIILRVTVSLSNAIVAAVLISVVISIVAMSVASDQIDELITLMFEGLLEQEENQSFFETMVTHVSVAGLIAYMLALNGISGVLLGRWFQARLYNPGGFGEEFREFRLSTVLAGVCFFGSLLCRLQGAEYWWWSNLLALPLLLVVIAIAHAIVKQRQYSVAWLVVCYLVVFILSPVFMTLGFLDAWLNFRNRLKIK